MIWVLGGALLLSTGLGYPVTSSFFIWLFCFLLPVFVFIVFSACLANISGGGGRGEEVCGEDSRCTDG